MYGYVCMCVCVCVCVWKLRTVRSKSTCDANAQPHCHNSQHIHHTFNIHRTFLLLWHTDELVQPTRDDHVLLNQPPRFLARKVVALVGLKQVAGRRV